MIARIVASVSSGVLLCSAAIDARAQTCQPRVEIVLNQESYHRLTDRIFVYTGDINSESARTSWRPFTIHVIVGLYRDPFLLPQSHLNERDFRTLFARRTDVKRDSVLVGFPSRGESVSVKSDKRSVVVRVVRVEPARGDNDRVIVEGCG